MADAASIRCEQRAKREPGSAKEKGGMCQSITASADVADTEYHTGRQSQRITRKSWWTIEPDVGLLADGLPARLVRWGDEPEGVPRVASGIPNRVDRLRGLGNAVVPQLVEAIGRMILTAEKER